MNGLEILLSRRWILKSRDKDLYYQMREQLGNVKKFLTEKLGYQVVVNPYLIKVEKMPAQAKPWMGIQEFNDRIQYVFLCLILSFLEEKEAEEQFVLSELTEYIQAEYREEQIDWTSYSYRRHLIRVVKFCVSCGILEVDDGSEDSFMRDAEGEVLYENTGASRYFMRNFTRNIMDYTKPEDFAEDEWLDVDTDRGLARRQRVYRKLLMSPGMYRNGDNDEDFAYIKNLRGRLAEELEELLECDLQVHRSSAFLIVREGGGLGRCFPEEKTLSDIALLCLNRIQQEVHSGRWELPMDECLRVSETEFRRLVEGCKEQYGSGFIKTYREMTTGDFYREVLDYLESLELIEVSGRQVVIWPAAGKLAGEYPQDYMPANRQEGEA
ncbi:MAG: TIGR02678 family protein [Clostridiaceae bacterium]|nr:TIGR02678 family protein [Clostridiaceae bacterium]